MIVPVQSKTTNKWLAVAMAMRIHVFCVTKKKNMDVTSLCASNVKWTLHAVHQRVTTHVD